MELYERFSLPISGMDDGVHLYHFKVGEKFFKGFEQSPIGQSQIQVDVEVDKRPDMLVFWFDIQGTMTESCDRCLAAIQLPIQGRHRLIGKLGSGEEEADVFYLSPELTSLNIAKFIYEYCALSVPLKKTYDCQSDENPPCDDSVLNTQEGDFDDDSNNPIWDQLKDLNFDR